VSELDFSLIHPSKDLLPVSFVAFWSIFHHRDTFVAPVINFSWAICQENWIGSLLWQN